MSKFEMKGYPSHHTGTQPKSLSNPIRFGIRAGEEDYTKFNPLQPFGNSAWGGVFSARGEYNAASAISKRLQRVKFSIVFFTSSYSKSYRIT
jgi:hypothetical protein